MSHWKPLVVPLKPQATLAHPASSSIVRLPTEILLMIVDQADDSLDKVCLALSCRRLLQVSALASLTVPEKCKGTGCPHDKILRRVGPRDKAGNPSSKWGMCVDCMQYCPGIKSYWKAKSGTSGKNADWDKAVQLGKMKKSAQCPECWREECQTSLHADPGHGISVYTLTRPSIPWSRLGAVESSHE
ncbi:hypothetical protein DM02DRAFT_660355 [Periconia macrospinosa]|uniref:F-box domain-containing protein n=1 Tax=Periconia macrospinosa TaxID=97972 RepID=A0A2V1DAW8_9PLEO|nr:hypothetical protein DM02DRAFT_660355 [Periconia macrospinosa]